VYRVTSSSGSSPTAPVRTRARFRESQLYETQMRCFLAKGEALSKELEHRAETSVVYFNDRLGVKLETA
jgi:hypothetical protein